MTMTATSLEGHMAVDEYDVIVIGAGPTGENVAGGRRAAG